MAQDSTGVFFVAMVREMFRGISAGTFYILLFDSAFVFWPLGSAWKMMLYFFSELLAEFTLRALCLICLMLLTANVCILRSRGLWTEGYEERDISLQFPRENSCLYLVRISFRIPYAFLIGMTLPIHCILSSFYRWTIYISVRAREPESLEYSIWNFVFTVWTLLSGIVRTSSWALI